MFRLMLVFGVPRFMLLFGVPCFVRMFGIRGFVLMPSVAGFMLVTGLGAVTRFDPAGIQEGNEELRTVDADVLDNAIGGLWRTEHAVRTREQSHGVTQPCSLRVVLRPVLEADDVSQRGTQGNGERTVVEDDVEFYPAVNMLRVAGPIDYGKDQYGAEAGENVSAISVHAAP